MYTIEILQALKDVRDNYSTLNTDQEPSSSDITNRSIMFENLMGDIDGIIKDFEGEEV